MTFRLRVFLLVMLVAVTAIGATAWLTLSLAARQVDDALRRGERDTTRVATDVAGFARYRGTWVGVDQRVRELSGNGRLRIRMETLQGTTVVDTDHLTGRAARRTPPTPTLVDPRPTFVLPLRLRPTAEGSTVAEARRYTADAIQQYRSLMALAGCVWLRYHETVKMIDRDDGVPALDPNEYLQPHDCIPDVPDAVPEPDAGDEAAVAACRLERGDPAGPGPAFAVCLSRVFTERISPTAPPPLRLYLGGVDDDPAALIGPPMLLAAGAVTLLALAGTAFLVRRVSRPVRALTLASRRLTDGNLHTRVKVDGHDELAQLSASFNRMAEALQRAEENQRRLVAGVAHELRTPLSNLRGYLEALQDGVVKPGPEVYASLHEEVLLQRRILDDLQDLALAEAGALRYRREPADLGDLVEVSRTAHLAVAEATGVELTGQRDGPLPVRVDQDRIRQVLGNLVTNALRYTDPGGRVVLRAFAASDLAFVEVRDTGCGIAATDLPNVFLRFWRADPARDRASGGSGLGLTIARQIAVDHGGRITVSSELGVGTVFTLVLPLRGDPAPMAQRGHG